MNEKRDSPAQAEAAEHTLNRKEFLRLAGLGGSALVMSPTACITNVHAEKPRIEAATLPLIAAKEFPIGVFWPPPPFETNVARYQEIAKAGFNFLITGNYLNDSYIINHALKMADQTGLKVLVSGDHRLLSLMQTFSITQNGGGSLELSKDEARTLLREITDTYAGHPSFAGINFFDEPGEQHRISNVAAGFSLFKELSPYSLPYTNLSRTFSNYTGRLQRLVAQVEPSHISFDHYPLLKSGVDESWFHDWAVVRKAGLEQNIPTWTFILSTGHGNYKEPTRAEILWQINVSLAYGCKGIQYFTYWTPDLSRNIKYGDALITKDGKRTAKYDAAQQINNAWLAPVGRELMPLTSEAIYAANMAKPPQGLPSLRPDNYIKKTGGDPIIISRFKDSGSSTQQWLLVVNYAPDRPAGASIDFGSNISSDGAAKFNSATGYYEKPSTSTTHLELSLKAGAAILYRLTLAS